MRFVLILLPFFETDFQYYSGGEISLLQKITAELSLAGNETSAEASTASWCQCEYRRTTVVAKNVMLTVAEMLTLPPVSVELGVPFLPL